MRNRRSRMVRPVGLHLLVAVLEGALPGDIRRRVRALVKPSRLVDVALEAIGPEAAECLHDPVPPGGDDTASLDGGEAVLHDLSSSTARRATGPSGASGPCGAIEPALRSDSRIGIRGLRCKGVPRG